MKVTNLDTFIKHAIMEYPNEVAGFLFTKHQYAADEVWLIFTVKNNSPTPEHAWQPEKKSMTKAKTDAKKMGYTKIGNIHSHPINGELPEHDVDELGLPSDVDLRFSKKFNDLVRIIVTVDQFRWRRIIAHDKFGNILPIKLEDNILQVFEDIKEFT